MPVHISVVVLLRSEYSCRAITDQMAQSYKPDSQQHNSILFCLNSRFLPALSFSSHFCQNFAQICSRRKYLFFVEQRFTLSFSLVPCGNEGFCVKKESVFYSGAAAIRRRTKAKPKSCFRSATLARRSWNSSGLKVSWSESKSVQAFRNSTSVKRHDPKFGALK